MTEPEGVLLSLFVPHGVVLEEARNVAQDLGLPAWWLNEQASVYISGKDDPGRRRVFDHPGLRVTAASPRHIFAMKALAATTRDVDDLRLLAGIIEVDSAETALRICAEFGVAVSPSQRRAGIDWIARANVWAATWWHSSTMTRPYSERIAAGSSAPVSDCSVARSIRPVSFVFLPPPSWPMSLGPRPRCSRSRSFHWSTSGVPPSMTWSMNGPVARPRRRAGPPWWSSRLLEAPPAR